MKPENHAIRQLEKQLDGATPGVAHHIVRVIAALSACITNSNHPTALAKAKESLAAELKLLEKASANPTQQESNQ